MTNEPQRELSRRERQIMDILFQRGSAAAAEIHVALPDPPSYSAVRAALAVLERKGHIKHEMENLRYVWRPRVGKERARKSALRHMLATFFDGNVEDAVAALIDDASSKLGPEDFDRLRGIVERAESLARTDGAKQGGKE